MYPTVTFDNAKNGKLIRIPIPAKTRYAGSKAGRGRQFQVVEIARKKPFPHVTRVYIGPNHLLHRAALVTADASQYAEVILTNIKVNQPIPTAAFAYAPPKTAKLLSIQPAHPPLLAAGTAAPDFTVNDKEGRPLKISDFRGKAIVLDFWATWCGPCRESMPHTNALAKKYEDVVVLAVNVYDTQ